jgi:hypothetical protein
MKKAIIAIAIAFSSLTGLAQEPASRLKFHSTDLGFGIFLLKKDGVVGGGAGLMVNAAVSLDKNLIAASFLTGSEIGIIRSSAYDFREFCLLYGREWRAAKWFAVEGFAGVGYYNQNGDINYADIPNYTEESRNAVSFPLRLNAKFYFNQKIGLGFNTNYSINSINNNLSINATLHYRFN